MLFVQVCEFGDVSIGKETVGTFQGQKPVISVSGDSHPVELTEIISLNQ